MDIVVLDGYTLFPERKYWREFEKFGNVNIYDRTKYNDIIKRIGNAPIVLTNKTSIDRNIIENTDIKYIGVLATGYNIIDMEACNEKGITVCNIPSYSTDAVAQLTFALLLEAVSKVHIHSESVKRGNWAICPDFSYTVAKLTEIKGKTMGLIGYGSIGKAVAKIANAFNMKVIYYKPSGAEANDTDLCSYKELPKLLASSDIISLHCPLTAETEEIINKNTLALVKKGAILINTARGGAINDKDVACALKEGILSCYLCDVLSKEPPSADNLIINSDYTIVTPHIAWQSTETKTRLLNIAVSNLEGFVNGNIINSVN